MDKQRRTLWTERIGSKAAERMKARKQYRTFEFMPEEYIMESQKWESFRIS